MNSHPVVNERISAADLREALLTPIAEICYPRCHEHPPIDIYSCNIASVNILLARSRPEIKLQALQQQGPIGPEGRIEGTLLHAIFPVPTPINQPMKTHAIIRMVDMLVAHGADISAANSQGKTVLQAATASQNAAIIGRVKYHLQQLYNRRNINIGASHKAMQRLQAIVPASSWRFLTASKYSVSARKG